LGDWRLLIIVLAQRTDASGVAKRAARYPSDKEFEIYMSTSIPDNEQAAYGLSNVKKRFSKKRTKNTHTFLCLILIVMIICMTIFLKVRSAR
jgi:hypothetical protein